MLSVAPTLADILRPIQEELTRVQERLQQRLGSRAPLLHEVMAYVFTGQGKQVRPALTLLSSAVGPAAHPEAALQIAVAIELIHTATLIHDDIVDAAVLRRNRPSLNAKWGNEVSVLSGDFLYARAFHLLAELNDPRVLAVMAQTGEEMSKGELAEVEHRCNWQLTEADYLDIVRAKTAVLMAAACQLGAHVSGATAEEVLALAAYGEQVGMAFQISDDCLDLVGDERLLGKTTGSDLLRGNLSLPLVYLREQLRGEEYQQTFGSLDLAQDAATETLATLARWARERHMIEQAYQKARAYAQQAKASLAALDGAAVYDSLLALADYAVNRHH